MSICEHMSLYEHIWAHMSIAITDIAATTAITSSIGSTDRNHHSHHDHQSQPSQPTQPPLPKPKAMSQEEQFRLSGPTTKQIDYLLGLLLERGETAEGAKTKIKKIATRAEASLAINRLRAGLKLLEQ